MTGDPTAFYGATVQTIPVLLLLLAVETSFLAGVARSGVVRRALESWAEGGVIPTPSMISMTPVIAMIWEGLARAALKSLAGPVGRAANLCLVFGTLLLAISAELLAFIGLAIDPGGTFIMWSFVVTLAAIALLLMETFWALTRLVLVSNRGEASDGPDGTEVQSQE